MKIIALVAAPDAADGRSREGVFDAVLAQVSATATDDDGLSGLVVSQVLKPFAAEDPLVAMVELWHDSTDPAQLVRQYVGTAGRLGAQVSAVATEEIVFKRVQDYAVPTSSWSIKLAGTAYRRDDFETEAFFRYWIDTHAPIGGAVPGVGGYVVSRVVDALDGNIDADAFIEQWYTDEAAFVAAQDTDQAKAAWNDVGNYAKTTGTFWLFTEHVLVRPPETGPGTLDVVDA